MVVLLVALSLSGLLFLFDRRLTMLMLTDHVESFGIAEDRDFPSHAARSAMETPDLLARDVRTFFRLVEQVKALRASTMGA